MMFFSTPIGYMFDKTGSFIIVIVQIYILKRLYSNGTSFGHIRTLWRSTVEFPGSFFQRRIYRMPCACCQRWPGNSVTRSSLVISCSCLATITCFDNRYWYNLSFFLILGSAAVPPQTIYEPHNNGNTKEKHDFFSVFSVAYSMGAKIQNSSL